MSILCTICARSSSKGLTKKALRKINNKPLISYTIRQAIKSKAFDKVIVTTDSKKIQNVAKIYGAESWFLRPKKLSSDYCSKLLFVRHALIEAEKYFKRNFQICVDLDITSPLRDVKDIIESIKKFKKKRCNNLISACISKKNPYFNMVERSGKGVKIVKEKKDSNKFSRSFASDFSVIRRQDAPKVYEMNASIYIYKRQALINKHKLLTKNTEIYLMPRNRSVDIDDIFDLNLVKMFIKNDKKLFK